MFPQEPLSSRDPSPSTTLGRFSRSRDDMELDIKQPETPVDETAGGGEPSRELKTLGEGPVAPGAAAEAAEGAEEEGEVNPGYKGWLNLLGVGAFLPRGETMLTGPGISCQLYLL
jgi:hypothetical protein